MATPARSLRILGAALAALLTVALHASAQQAIIVVRHAEKADQTPDTALSGAGKARAKALGCRLQAAAPEERRRDCQPSRPAGLQPAARLESSVPPVTPVDDRRPMLFDRVSRSCVRST